MDDLKKSQQELWNARKLSQIIRTREGKIVLDW